MKKFMTYALAATISVAAYANENKPALTQEELKDFVTVVRTENNEKVEVSKRDAAVFVAGFAAGAAAVKYGPMAYDAIAGLFAKAPAAPQAPANP